VKLPRSLAVRGKGHVGIVIITPEGTTTYKLMNAEVTVSGHLVHDGEVSIFDIRTTDSVFVEYVAHPPLPGLQLGE
jgi:hypothetical protein